MRSIYHRFGLLVLLLSLSFVFCFFAHARSRDKYVPGELIVKLKEGLHVFDSSTTSSTPKSARSLLDLNRKSGVKSSRKLFPGLRRASLTTSFLFRGEVRRTPSLSNIHVLKLPDDRDMEKLAEEYQKDENVIYAEPNYYLYADVIPNDPDFPQQWGLHNTGQYGLADADIDAPEAWDLETGGSSVIIAIIDSGIDMSHEDLDGKIWTNMGETPDDGIDNDGNGYIDDVRGWDFIDNDNDPSDYLGHGTHVAGIAAAETDNGVGIAGVSWDARIMNIRILNNSGNGTFSDAADAVIYAAQKGAKVINMSFGSYAYSSLLEDALANAYATSLLVASAGNDGVEIHPIYRQPHYPSAYDYVVGVGATDVIFDILTDTWIETKARFSNYGVNADVYAPGVSIYSTVPHDNYIAWNGTSMSAPLVSGLAGLIFSYRSGLSYEQVRVRIIKTADAISGGTRINAYNALSVESIPPDVRYVSHYIDDSIGDADNDGIADSGETVNMVFTVKNYGGLATNVVAMLRTRADPWTQVPDPFITITSDTASFSAISAYAMDDNDGSTGAPGDTPLVFSVASDTPNNHPVIFVLDISADGGYEASHEFTIYTQRGREISGVIDEDTAWGGYRYIVVGNVLVAAGVTLTIEPGTEILFNEEKYLQVDGCLEAIGTEDDMILFSSNSPDQAPGDWGYIKFTDLSIDAEFNTSGNYVSGSVIKYSEIELGTGIWAYYASPYIAYNFIHDNYMEDSPCYSSVFLDTSSSVVEHNFIVSNLEGWGGIYLFCCSEARVSHNVIESNYTAGSMSAGIGLESCSSVEVNRNTIRGNGALSPGNLGAGIMVRNSEEHSVSHIAYNTIDNGSPPGGIGIYFDSFTSSEQCMNNTIMHNQGGILVRYATPVISHNNIINNRQSSDQYEIDQWIPSFDINALNNYWGTTDSNLISEYIRDYYDDFSLGKVSYEPFETTPVTDAPGFLYQLSLDPPSPVSIETVTFNLTFSREMDTTVEAMVTFGVDNPYTQHQVLGDWLDDTHWQGTYDIDIATGDGINTIRATQAEDSDGMEIPKDTRFSFDIDTMSSAAADFMASPGNAQVALSWTSTGDIPNLAGYSIYRSTQSGENYQQVNDTLVTSTSYIDTDVSNGTPYYYVMTVMSTDPYESGYSDEVSATPMDTTSPTTPVVTDDGEYTSDKTQLHAMWTSEDPESGIAGYKYAIGTSPGGQEIVSWQSVGTATSVTHTGLNLVTGVTFYFAVQAKNGSGAWSETGVSNGIGLDITPPETTTALDGTAGENDWYTSNVEITLTATDDSSGVKETKYRINEDTWEVYTSPFEVTGSTVHYYSEDNASNVEDENQIEVKIDKTPPDTPAVTDDGECTTDGTQLHATWTSADAESGVIEYQYAIGTTSGGTDVVGWTSTGADNYVTATELTLTLGETYYFSVKAKNEAGSWSSEGYSDGITYQLPQIAAAPASFTFNVASGGGNPGDQTLSISNSGCGTLNWNVNGDAGWLSVSPEDGSCTTETDDVTVSVDTAGLAEGTHNATITISAIAASNTSQNISVTLNIIPIPYESLVIEAFSPVDLIVTDPQGRTISQAGSTIPSSSYIEGDVNGDGESDDVVIILNPLLGGYSIDVTPEPGAEPTDTYTLDVSYGGESNRLAEDVQIQSIPDEPYAVFFSQYQMDAGWHLISLPRQPDNTGVTSVLSSDKYDCIYSYSPVLGWRWYLTDTPQVSNLSDLVSGVGYWILVEEPCSLIMQGEEPSTEILLTFGWNLVGYTLGESKPIVDCMYSINGEYTSVWEYDPILGWRWYFPASPQTSNLTSMRPGFGYWIKVITGCLWDVSVDGSP